MQIISIIAQRAEAAALPFLMIGGHAVIAYGYPRQTADVDFLVQERHRREWDDLILSLGYGHHHVQRSFQMYNPAEAALPAIDLMLVDEQTFSKLAADAGIATVGEARVTIPSLRHLIALKLHALRSSQIERRERDMGDILTLMRLNQITLASADYEEIFERYASAALRHEIESRLVGPESSDA
jgi:hypothetical protein